MRLARSFSCVQGLLPIVLLSSPLRLAHAQVADPAVADLRARVAAYVDPLVRNREFSGTVRIVRGDEVIFDQTWGFRDVVTGEPHTERSRFRIASVSKTLTAAAIVRLRDEGRLSYDDLVSRHLPEFAHGDRIRIRHLLRFESGLVDIDPQERLTSETLLEAIGSQPLAFEPGSDSRYGNAGFDVLALVVEAVTGQDLGSYFRRAFFDPLGMTDTGFLRDLDDETTALTSPHAPGPPPALATVVSSGNPTNYIGSGGAYSSARDLTRWGRAVVEGVPIDLGAEDYPWGWGTTENEGREGYMQTGMTRGYVSSLQVFPAEGLVVALVSNVEAGLWSDWSRDLATIVLGGEPGLEPEVYALTSPPAEPGRYTGRYERDADRFVMIRESEGALWLHLDDYPVGRRLLPLAGGGFQLRDFTGRIFFQLGADGRAHSLRWELPSTWDAEPEIYERSTEPPPDSEWGLDRSVSRREAVDDLTDLVELLESHHPRLYRFQTLTEWEEAKAAALGSIGDSISRVSFYRVLWSLLASIQDGHTRLFAAAGLDLAALPELPLEVMWTGEQAVVTGSRAPGVEHLVGGRIESIDGIPISRVMAIVEGRMYSDGGSPTGKRAAINSAWARWVALFHSAPAERTLGMRWPDSTASVSLVSVPASRYPPADPGPERVLSISEAAADGAIAYLAFDHFEDPRADLPFTEWISSVFSRIEAAGAEVLILDLRRNGGGPTRHGVALVAHLVPRAFQYTLRIDTRAAEIPRFESTGWPNEYQEIFRSGVGDRIDRDRHAFTDVAGWYGTGVTSPLAPMFEGPLIVLIDGLTFSTASDVSSVLRRTRDVTFLGEATGGAADGNASGFMPSLALANSGFRVQLPLLQFHIASPEEAAGETGVPPTERIRPSIDDILAGRDPVLERAYELAREWLR